MRQIQNLIIRSSVDVDAIYVGWNQSAGDRRTRCLDVSKRRARIDSKIVLLISSHYFCDYQQVLAWYVDEIVKIGVDTRASHKIN